MKPKKVIIIPLLILIILFLVFFPYMKAEYLTLKYGYEFENLQRQTNMLSEVRYYKVLSYSDEVAEVFYVSDTGDLITFKKSEENIWTYTEWKTIWSNSGSADGFVWPYYH